MAEHIQNPESAGEAEDIREEWIEQVANRIDRLGLEEHFWDGIKSEPDVFDGPSPDSLRSRCLPHLVELNRLKIGRAERSVSGKADQALEQSIRDWVAIHRIPEFDWLLSAVREALDSM